MYHKRGLWVIKAKNAGVFLRHNLKSSPPKLQEKFPKFYPADGVKTSILNQHKHKPTELKSALRRGMVTTSIESILSFHHK